MTPKVTQPRCLHFIEIFSLVKIFLGSRKYFTMTKLIQMTLLFVSNCSRYWVLIYLLFSFQSPHWFVCLLRIIETKYLWKTVEKELFDLTTNAIEFEKRVNDVSRVRLSVTHYLLRVNHRDFPNFSLFLISSFTTIQIQEIFKKTNNVFVKLFFWISHYHFGEPW